MKRMLVLGFLVGVLGTPLPAWGAGLDAMSRGMVEDWARERDHAATQYLASWLRGDDARARVSSGLTILAREAGIVALIRDKDPDLLARYSLFWGRRVTPDTLPVALLEKRGVRLDATALFAGRTFSLEKSSAFKDRRH